MSNAELRLRADRVGQLSVFISMLPFLAQLPAHPVMPCSGLRWTYRLFSLLLILAMASGQARAQRFIGCDAVLQVPREECIALEALFNSTNGATWSRRNGWLSIGNVCEWTGIECNSQPWPRNVTQINLVNNNVGGNLPVELSFLTELTHLVIENRPVSGEIIRLGGSLPPDLEELSNLKVLKLSNNEIYGGLPTGYAVLQNLEVLELANNRLEGFIPAAYGNLKALRTLDLSRNQLYGEIPPSIGRLKSLENLDLSFNQLGGAISDSLGELSSLLTLNLQSNQLSGIVPPSLGRLPSLKWLSLAENDLQGSLSPRVALFSQNLNFCALENNGPSFCIPDHAVFRQINNDSICGVPLDSACSFCNGSVTIEKSDCQALESFYLDTKGYDWTNDSEWLVNQNPCLWFGIGCNGMQVTQIKLPNNNLAGILTEGLGELQQLDVLDLSSNHLEGPVPFSIAKAGSTASYCSLSNNDTSLCMPAESPYSELGTPSICELPLNSTCKAVSLSRITSFSAEIEGNTIRLRWMLNIGVANSSYEIEQKKGDQFVTVDSFTAQDSGEEATLFERSLTREEPGLYIFRLKQVRADGSFAYSEELEVLVGISSDLVLDGLYPNPTPSSSTLRFALTVPQQVRIDLYNALGQRVRTLLSAPLSEGRAYTIQIERRDLSDGLYFVHILGESFNVTQALLLLR